MSLKVTAFIMVGQSLLGFLVKLKAFSRSEQHGRGEEQVVLIMGLNSSSFSWGPQVALLAKEHSVLVFDNRGVGNSDAPRGPYTSVHTWLVRNKFLTSVI